MKIAVAAMGNTVSGHFGHCENFNIYDAEDGKITAEEVVANPGHRPGFLPNFLADRGVQVIIAGGMGGGQRVPLGGGLQKMGKLRAPRIARPQRQLGQALFVVHGQNSSRTSRP